MRRIICANCGADVTALVGNAGHDDIYGGCASCRSFGTIILTLPTIHLNGTSKERLIEGLCEASSAIGAAYEAMKRVAPNGRDYYPQGQAGLVDAENEHLARLKKIDDVKVEIDSLIQAIDLRYQIGDHHEP